MTHRKTPKLIVSLFIAALLMLCLLVPGFAETDAEAQLAAANAEVAACEQALKDANAAYTTAQEQSKKGMYGFFLANGSENAVKTLDNAKYRNLISYGAAGDATSMENLSAALDLLEEVNAVRKNQGLKELVITDTMMAMAEADADAFYDLGVTPKQFTVNGNRIAENLGTFASAKAAVESWSSEKALAEEHPEYMDYSNANWYRVGHWYNMTRENFQVTGVAVNTRQGNKFCQVFYGSAGNEKTYTVAEYRQRIADYNASPEQKKQAVADAETALANAKAKQAAAEAAVQAEA